MENIGLEDEHREFKESTVELDKGLISLVSMLNKSGYGTVYFGVRDNGDIIGQDIGKMTLKDITQSIRNQIDPPVIASVEVNESADGKKYITVFVKGTERPYACRNVIYIRTGEEDRKVPMSELRKMFMSSSDNLVFSVSNNQSLTFCELCKIYESNGLHISDNKGMYHSLDLLNPEGKFNMQAQLLSDQNPVALTVAIFKGLDRTQIALRTDFSGHCLLHEVQSVLDYVSTLNETFVTVGESKRIEQSLFDGSAFKESWVNACVHNNWVGATPPAVHIFDDRMEVISYGDKPYWLSMDDFYSGRSMPVNESLMRVFISTKISEHTGHGMPVIVNSYGTDAIKCSSSGVTVTIPFSRMRAGASLRVGGIILTENEKLVLEALALHSNAKLEDIARMTGLSRSYVGKVAAKLQNIGLVTRQGSLKSSTWIVHQRGSYRCTAQGIVRE